MKLVSDSIEVTINFLENNGYIVMKKTYPINPQPYPYPNFPSTPPITVSYEPYLLS